MDERWIPTPVFTGTGYARWMGEVGTDSRLRGNNGPGVGREDRKMREVMATRFLVEPRNEVGALG